MNYHNPNYLSSNSKKCPTPYKCKYLLYKRFIYELVTDVEERLLQMHALVILEALFNYYFTYLCKDFLILNFYLYANIA